MYKLHKILAGKEIKHLLLQHFNVRRHITKYKKWQNILHNILAICLLTMFCTIILWEFKEVNLPISSLDYNQISLDPLNLFAYSLRTLFRMIAALIISLIFSIIYATLAAKNRRLGEILIPILDFFQSVPILGYISLTITAFLSLFPGMVLGAECAAIFAIFTSQVWNMTFSIYYSLKNTPPELIEAAGMLRLSKWQQFWRVEIPYAIPDLVWNACISMSSSWFFVVASEVITVGPTKITLPGIGAYIGMALREQNMHAIVYAVLAMITTIIVYNKILFKPLIIWSNKFLYEAGSNNSKTTTSFFMSLFQKTIIFIKLKNIFRCFADYIIYLPIFNYQLNSEIQQIKSRKSLKLIKLFDYLWYIFLAFLIFFLAHYLFDFLYLHVSLHDMLHIAKLSLITTIRIFVMLFLVSLIWIPVGVYIGLHPKLASAISPIIQFAAAFPINLMFPLTVVGITHYNLNPNIWLSPLVIFGSQWYILFNVISGATSISTDLKEISELMNIKGVLWWRKVIIPSIIPYFLTGCITAAGGAWNATIVAEIVTFGNTTLIADGVGSYITQATNAANYPQIVISITIMAFIVLILNKILWQPLHNFVMKKYKS